MAIPTGDASEIPAATSFIEGPNGRRPPQMNTQISGSSSQVSNLKELEW